MPLKRSFIRTYLSFGILAVAILPCSLHAQEYGSSGGGSGEFEKKSNSNGRYGFVVDYSIYNSSVTAAGVEVETASEYGYGFGIELVVPTRTPKGGWILGVSYVRQKFKMQANGVWESISIDSVQTPVLYSFFLFSHLQFGLGVVARYDFDRIERKVDDVITPITHQEFGISNFQVDGTVMVRIVMKKKSKTQFFVDLRHGVGLTDRALGTADTWKDSQTFSGFGILF